MDRICVTRLYMADLIRRARSRDEVRKSFDRPGMILIRIQQKIELPAHDRYLRAEKFWRPIHDRPVSSKKF